VPGFDGVVGVERAAARSGLRRLLGAPAKMPGDLSLGGDCGGCRTTAGVAARAAGFGLRMGFVDEGRGGGTRMLAAGVSAAAGGTGPGFGRSLTHAGTTGDEGAVAAGVVEVISRLLSLNSRSLSGFGAGEMGREGGF
jgi:hypothetical protein